MSQRILRPTAQLLLRSRTSAPVQSILHSRRAFHASRSNMTVHNIATFEEFKEALAKHPAVLVDFYATWCGPCKAIAPKVAEWSDKYTNLHVLKVDVDAVPAVAQEYGIRAMPTFVFFKDGEEGDKMVGAKVPDLLALVEKYNAA